MPQLFIFNLCFKFMTHVFYEITEPYSAKKMFDLVNDIDAYPKFIPDCVDAGILLRQENVIQAYIEVEKLGFRKKFITLNKLFEPYRIEISLIEGPFKKLTGNWNFTEITENKCKISFNLIFEFKNKLLDITFTPLFKELMENMVKQFSSRAKQIYA